MRKMVRDFAEKECAPEAEERDEKEEFPRGIWNKLADLGLAGITFPDKYGGVEADYLSYAIAVEELSRVDASVGVTVSPHSSLCANPLLSYDELVFDNVRVPAENLLGEEGQGFKIAMLTLDYGRIGITSQALGIA